MYFQNNIIPAEGDLLTLLDIYLAVDAISIDDSIF